MSTIHVPALSALAEQLSRPNVHLARMGWEFRSVEVDSVSRRVDAQAHHSSGRWVHLRIEDRGATLERWQRETPLNRPRWGGPSCTQVEDTFLGRIHLPGGVQSAMRALADYMSDHAEVTRQLGRDTVRPALAAFLAVEADS